MRGGPGRTSAGRRSRGGKRRVRAVSAACGRAVRRSRRPARTTGCADSYLCAELVACTVRVRLAGTSSRDGRGAGCGRRVPGAPGGSGGECPVRRLVAGCRARSVHRTSSAHRYELAGRAWCWVGERAARWVRVASPVAGVPCAQRRCRAAQAGARSSRPCWAPWMWSAAPDWSRRIRVLVPRTRAPAPVIQSDGTSQARCPRLEPPDPRARSSHAGSGSRHPVGRHLASSVPPTGFEPATFCSGGRRSIH